MRIFCPFLGLLSFAALFLCSCTHNTPTPITVVPITKNISIPMPPLKDVGRSLEVTQLVTVHYQNKQFVFEGHISVTPENFVMVGLDSFGRKAITITWTKEGVLYQSAAFVPAQLHPENILADIVLLYWPEASLRRAMVGSSLKLITGRYSRIVMQGDKKIMEVHYSLKTLKNVWNGKLHYQNFVWGYEMAIQSVEMTQ